MSQSISDHADDSYDDDEDHGLNSDGHELSVMEEEEDSEEESDEEESDEEERDEEESDEEESDGEDQILAAQFEDYARRVNSASILRDLEVMLGIKENISCEVLEYIQNLKYPKALIGDFKVPPRDHPILEYRGPLTNEKEVELFRHINTILQDPRCIHWRNLHFAPATQKTCAVHISRYVLYIARNTAMGASTFQIDGKLMKSCFENLVETGDNLLRKEGRRVRHTSMKTFRYAMTILQYCLGIVYTSHLNKPERARQLESRWTRIPLLDTFNDLLQKKQHEHFELLKAKYSNKAMSQLSQPKYTEAQHHQMMLNMLEKTGSGLKEDVYDGIGAHLAFSLGHHYLFHALDLLLLELSNTVYSVEETAKGSVPILGFQFLKDKAMHFHTSPGLLGACRNKNVVICPVMAVAMSIWHQLDHDSHHGPLSGRSRPDFLDKSEWYDSKVVYCNSQESRAQKAISSSKLSKLMGTCLESINLQSSKKTHIGKVTNSARADAYGVSGDQIRRQCRWQLDVLESTYISSYAHEFIHFSGGFKRDEAYFIARDIPVPEELQVQIFPWLEEEIQKVKARSHAKETHMIDQVGMAIRILEMLKLFRPIILQDLALLVDLVPNSIYAKHPVTLDPRFLAFKEEVKRSQDERNDYASVPRLRQAADILAPQFGYKLDLLNQRLNALQRDFRELTSATSLEQKRIYDELPELLATNLNEQVISRMDQQFTDLSQSLIEAQRFQTKYTLQAIGGQFDSFARSSFGSICVKMLMEQFDKVMPAYLGQAFMTLNDQLSPNGPTDLDGGPKRKKVKREPPPDLREPQFRLLEEISSIALVWDEWHNSTPGKPSIKERDATFGTKWRCDQGDPYMRRRRIIRFIDRLKRSFVVDTVKAIELLENYSKRFQNSSMRAMTTSLSHKALADGIFTTIARLANLVRREDDSY